ncbi:MAG: class I SAM-dependent methyltransferase [Candidatus Woesearchaeota archaeon]
MVAFGYFPQKNKLKDFLFKIVGLPHPSGRLRAKHFFKLVEKKSKTLDVGCGEGAFCRELAKLGIEVVGLDTNKRSLEYAKKAAQACGLNIKFVLANAEKIPFKDSSFSQVICLDVLEHVDDSQKVISEIRRVLKRRGIFIVSVPTPYYLTKSLTGISFSEHLKAIGHKSAGYSYPELKALLERNGFEVTKHIEYYGFFSRLVNEVFYAILGAKRISKAREEMYDSSFLAQLSFFAIYSIMQLDALCPFTKKGGVMVKAIKK